jgi:hypothetical protein
VVPSAWKLAHLFRHKLLLAITLAWIFVTGTFYAYKPGSLQLASMLVSLAFLFAFPFNIRAAFVDWRAYRWIALVPLLACILAVPAASGLGGAIGACLFSKNLPRYSAIVARQDVQAVGEKKIFIPLSDAEKELTYAVFAQRTPAGTLIVEIATEGGFPVKHAGYLFSSSGEIPKTPELSYRWPYQERLNPHWFRVID